jgi:hypothetical protein
MPFPQSFPAGKGIADTLQTSIAAMNSDAFIGVCCGLCCCVVVDCIVFMVLLCIYYFYSCMNATIKMKKRGGRSMDATRPHNSQLVATVVPTFVISCATFAARGCLVLAG